MTILSDIFKIKASLIIYFIYLNRLRVNFYFPNMSESEYFSNKVFIKKRNDDEIMKMNNFNVELKFKE